jgi:hypothetical protein
MMPEKDERVPYKELSVPRRECRHENGEKQQMPNRYDTRQGLDAFAKSCHDCLLQKSARWPQINHSQEEPLRSI